MLYPNNFQIFNLPLTASVNLYPADRYLIGGKFLNFAMGVGVFLCLQSPCPKAPELEKNKLKKKLRDLPP